MSFIEFHDLTHCYNLGQKNEHRAIDGLDLSIEKGSFTAILGQNGSGKSTLAKHINGLLLPTSGICLVDGKDTRNLEELWQIRRQVGMVFQNPDNQLIAAVVEDDVAFGPENLGLEPQVIRAKVDEALKAVNMTKYKNFAPHLLSGGQKQRIAIAGALAMDTECLVLDEPTAMLDPQGRAEVLRTVRKLHEERGITIVYITHFMEEAAVADRVVLMDSGRAAADGTPREIFADVPGMKKRGLDVPLAAEVSWQLRRQGIKLPDGIITEDELVEALEAYTCQSN
ncbi:energy-coupling factor transporter ATPase [Selenomonas ruminis]|uniref:ABC transporter ATP-binding protein n=1 Tax=Selenomonas ruminis TaxID=2593411 RepID=A0A5D6W8A3_9FIRM|nr:energy-coupling factor transporter ATPase [Selenomonas sp. mPRGC5]TYZ23018.1 energy-coupling factor transporter ATPase [Selenomonas sp. mPRGC5]